MAPDTLTLSGGTTATLSNVEVINGSAQSERRPSARASPAPVIDLGANSDQIALGNCSTTLTATGIETILGNATNDVVTIGASMTNAFVDLGGSTV